MSAETKATDLELSEIKKVNLDSLANLQRRFASNLDAVARVPLEQLTGQHLQQLQSTIERNTKLLAASEEQGAVAEIARLEKFAADLTAMAAEIGGAGGSPEAAKTAQARFIVLASDYKEAVTPSWLTGGGRRASVPALPSMPLNSSVAPKARVVRSASISGLIPPLTPLQARIQAIKAQCWDLTALRKEQLTALSAQLATLVRDIEKLADSSKQLELADLYALQAKIAEQQGKANVDILSYYEKQRRLIETSLGKADWSLVAVLNKLIEIYRALGKKSQAGDCVNQVADIRNNWWQMIATAEKQLAKIKTERGATDSSLAAPIRNLHKLCLQQGLLTKAAEYLKEAESIEAKVALTKPASASAGFFAQKSSAEGKQLGPAQLEAKRQEAKQSLTTAAAPAASLKNPGGSSGAAGAASEKEAVVEDSSVAKSFS